MCLWGAIPPIITSHIIHILAVLVPTEIAAGKSFSFWADTHTRTHTLTRDAVILSTCSLKTLFNVILNFHFCQTQSHRTAPDVAERQQHTQRRIRDALTAQLTYQRQTERDALALQASRSTHQFNIIVRCWCQTWRGENTGLPDCCSDYRDSYTSSSSRKH